MTQKSVYRYFTILFIIAAAFLLLTSSAAAKSYSFDRVDADIVIDENGVTHVTEKIHYSFSTYPGDEYNEVYRTVFAGYNGITMRNATGYLEGYPDAEFRVARVSDGYELICELPKPNPSSVVFVVSYEFLGGINAYNDVTEFNYVLWSNLWDRPLPILNTTITIQNVSVIEDFDSHFAFVHPVDYFTSVSLNSETRSGDQTETMTVKIQAANIPAYRWVDTRIIYPPMLSPDPQYVNVINKDGLQDIMDEERAYEMRSIFPFVLMLVQLLIILIGIAVAVFIYFKYGKEYKTDYAGLYERELPTDTKPALINAIISGHGKPNMNAFVSTIMSLVDRDYLSISEINVSNSRKNSKEIILKFEKPHDSGLAKIESDVYHFLKRYAANDEIIWRDFQKKLGSNTNFYNFLNSWYSSVSTASDFTSYFEHKGNSRIAGAGIGLIVVSVLMFFLSEILAPSDLYPATAAVGMVCLLGVILGITFIIYPIVFKKSMGRWTKDGRVFYLKWKNFEKYLTDYSLIEKYPPSSVIIWDHYIVYAMALGVAETALKNMKLASPAAQMQSSHFYYIHYYPFFYVGMNSAYSSSVPQSSGGGGGPGGGFGGGGIGGGFGGGFGGAR